MEKSNYTISLRYVPKFLIASILCLNINFRTRNSFNRKHIKTTLAIHIQLLSVTAYSYLRYVNLNLKNIVISKVKRV